eukprot:3196871-Prymnesium_polylepis.1
MTTIAEQVHLLSAGTAQEKAAAAYSLAHLASSTNPQTQATIARAGGVAPLVSLCRHGVGKQKQLAAL